MHYFCILILPSAFGAMATDRIVGIAWAPRIPSWAFMQGESPVVIPGDDGSNLVPSVVALDENNQPVIRHAARKHLTDGPNVPSTRSKTPDGTGR